MPEPHGERPVVAIETLGSELGDSLTERLGRWGYHVLRQPGQTWLGADGTPQAPDVLLRELSLDSTQDRDLTVLDGPDEPPTILLDAEGDLPSALAARRAGAAAVVTGPVDWPSLKNAVSTAISSGRRHRHLRDMANRVVQAGGPAVTWGSSPEPEWVTRLDRISASAAPTILWGEPGSGKRTLARSMHALGSKPDGPLISVRGRAPTGPSDPPGSHLRPHGPETLILNAWDRALGGTLLVDGITDLDPEAQWVLAELLEAQSGPHGSPAAQVRLVGTSTADPFGAIEDGDLGEDLYYRVVFVLPTLPLRKRREEIGTFAHHFVTHANRRQGLEVEGLRSEVLEALRRADWPGNLSELRGVVERACILAESGWLDVHHLPPYFRREQSGPPEDIAIPVGTSAAEAERKLILATLERTGFNKAEAARQLQVDVKTIRNKLRSYGLG